VGHEDQDDWGIEEQAALWVQLMSGAEADQYRAGFKRWHSQSPRHQREFLLASIVDCQFHSLDLIPSLRRDALVDDEVRKS
jgi:ferric-dicitrate binding protein FerR (iron transport regulator)